MKRYLSLSVHDLVDFLLRDGDIDDRVYNSDTMQEGTRLHGTYQKKQGTSYKSEVPLSCSIEVEEGTISLQGRADGIIVGGEYPIVDEIKTTVDDLDHFHRQQEAWHLGQAICYAYMYLRMEGGDKAGIRLTYIHQIDNDKKLIADYVYSFDELKSAIEGYCRDYFKFHAIYERRTQERDESATTLSFPYGRFRAGQRDLSKAVYNLMSKGGTFLAEAPTGIGKTMSVLFGASKRFEKGRLDKIFYLTAKTTGALSAIRAAEDLCASGLKASYIHLRAKEKACPTPGIGCNPIECPLARGYYGKVKALLEEALTSGKPFDTPYVEGLALREEICPFEFQLDLSLFVDIIVADYNYFFDPIVYLQRFFAEEKDGSTYGILVDEAHNLLERGRDMYSAELSLNEADAARRSLKGDHYKALRRAVTRIEAEIGNLLPEVGERKILEHKPEALIEAIESYKQTLARAKKKRLPPSFPMEYREFSRDMNRFYRIAEEECDSTYVIYASHPRSGVGSVRLYCVDPAKKIAKKTKKVKGGVFFSATLSPISYYADALLDDEHTPSLLLSSPFPKENMLLMVAPKVQVRYKQRQQSYPEVAKYLSTFVAGKQGNYFLFFPSYEYLSGIAPFLDFGDANVHVQGRGMTHREREEFLSYFPPSPKETNVGLLILGGSFSEGVDLVSDRLIGVAVVGVGMPQIGGDNDLIKEYFDHRDKNGFNYAYRDPGIVKVLQAVGRLIRSETDRGAALLLDERYLYREYRELIGRLYPRYAVVFTPEQVEETLRARFRKKKD